MVTGFGHVVLGEGATCDPRRWLESPKARKFMGLQEEMSVVAAGLAVESAGLGARPSLGERAGLYMAVGYIPFEEQFISPLVDRAVEDGEFSMAQLSTEGYRAVRPLLTFRCLPNMPAFHISTSFDIQGPYVVTYPGAGQLYGALEQAVMALECGAVDVALLGAVAHQRNFLVEHHFGRLDHKPSGALLDAAGFVVLERAGDAQARGAAIRGRCLGFEVDYRPHDPFEEERAQAERLTWDEDGAAVEAPGELGAASLLVLLSEAAGGRRRGGLSHALEARDMITASSRWELT